MKKNQGFTLIELLVVIAIIGILASVVLASLNSARNKGADSAIKSNLANARAQAEIFYDSNRNTYYGAAAANQLCNVNGVAIDGTTITGIFKNVQAAAKATGITLTTTPTTGQATTGTTTANVVCNVTSQAWVVAVPLKNQSTGKELYCVDSTGFSGEVATATAIASATDYTCN